ncbi:MAG: hypothetical protein ACJ789_15335 [Thermomicrobiales bacterium]
MHDDPQQQALGSEHDVPLAAGQLLAPSVAARLPFSVVFALWLSMIAALGVGSRPACRRTCSRSAAVMCSQVPSAGAFLSGTIANLFGVQFAVAAGALIVIALVALTAFRNDEIREAF